MCVSVFVGVSIDGFIAREDGSLDYLKPFEGEDHGYDEFMRTIDALVVGRSTLRDGTRVRRLAVDRKARRRAHPPAAHPASRRDHARRRPRASRGPTPELLT